VKIAVNSKDSLSKSFVNFEFEIPDSINNSNQKADSSASSSTIPIFALNSACYLPLHADR
jgi:hypothetical protein